MAGTSAAFSQSECNDTIIINETNYVLPERWCNNRIDSTAHAELNLLKRLPDDLTFQNFRIYVTPETKMSLLSMSSAAIKDSIVLIVDSGYRSVSFQRQIIAKRLASGEEYEKVINFVAPPGFSEHHTGRAIDFVPSEARFAHTETYQWLRANAHLFGFYETYPEDTTGFMPWESWHWIFLPNSLEEK